MTPPAEAIVVGACPVGFLTALGLARAGIDVCVLEAESDAMAAADALTAVIRKRRDDSVLDFYSAERGRVFLEVSSPLATQFKRRMSERDPAKRQDDVAMMRRMVEDPASAPSATHLAKLLFGAPMPV